MANGMLAMSCCLPGSALRYVRNIGTVLATTSETVKLAMVTS